VTGASGVDTLPAFEPESEPEPEPAEPINAKPAHYDPRLAFSARQTQATTL